MCVYVYDRVRASASGLPDLSCHSVYSSKISRAETAAVGKWHAIPFFNLARSVRSLSRP